MIMETLVNTLATTGNLIEWLAWGTIVLVLFLGLLLRIGEALQHAISCLWPHASHGRLTRPRIATFVLASALIAAALAVPVSAYAQGWWWGSPVNPGFDRNTVVRVSGTVVRVSFDARSGPATLMLECPRDTYTVMLGPARYLAQLRPDIQAGDPLTVEGSKMMDRGGNLYLVAARVTNERSAAVLTLRDDMGRPRWMGPRPGPMVP
jgi:hypothetical protein